MPKTVEEIYQKKEQLEHVLDLPDTYVGSVEPTELTAWVFENDLNKMVKRDITITPALYKIFDEVMVNAYDQYVRLKQEKSKNPVTQIKVTIDADSGEISVMNNGEGIPVAVHKEHKLHVPEMIFGEFLTSSNYDKTQEKVTGGKNGFGAKLTNAYSNMFRIETVGLNEQGEQKKFVQTFENNMSTRGKPKLTKWSKASYTKITFCPDFPRFGMTGLDTDTVALLTRRVYDIAGVADRDLTVYLNGKKLLSGAGKATPFERYAEMYVGKNKDKPKVYYQPHDRWEICVCLSADEKMEHVSFVNGINTLKGGKHVEHVSNKLAKTILDTLKSKRGGEAEFGNMKTSHIKDNIWLFLRSTIVNPSFDSQIKETLTTVSSKFGSTFSLNPGKKTADKKFIAELIKKTGIVERAKQLCQHKQQVDLAKTDGKNTRTVRGIPKLEDANKAGTKDSDKCVLIITEGDSAKALAMAGYGEVGRDHYGIFPLRGKLLNTRDASACSVSGNAEITALKKIIGLRQGVKYESVEGLRYGAVLIMTDQDVDGYHIQGLVINFFHTFWPELLEIPGFIRTLPTPIVKCTKGRGKNKEVISFYTEQEYETWKDQTDPTEVRKWKSKYYKGLGTSTRAEAKEIMKGLEENYQQYYSDDKKLTEQMLRLAFAKGKGKSMTDLRKEWLCNYDPSQTVDNNAKQVTFCDFINKRMKHFSTDDNYRSIPSMIDGLKPSYRKILFATLKKNLKDEIKVAQLAGYVAEVSGYHHGEQSLAGTIIGMAADYVGSNNINLLMPNGQFGTRVNGGKDHASPRYIFTELNPITQKIYHPDDSPLLEFLEDDNTPIEPKYYVPVIPMILVNGADGIGTGYSTTIPCYNPVGVINALRRLINGEECPQLKPWFRGFTGDVKKSEGKYQTFGKYEVVDDTTVKITELPIQTWTADYKNFLETLLYGAPIKEQKDKKKMKKQKDKQCLVNYTPYYDDVSVTFLLKFRKGKLKEMLKDPMQFMKTLKLVSSDAVSVTNMHLFDDEYNMSRYDTEAKQILESFFLIRLDYYVKRKAYLEKKLKREFDMNAAKVRFLEEHQEKKIVLFDKETEEIVQQLSDRDYPKFTKKLIVEPTETDLLDASYDYLLDMPLRSLTKKRLAELRKARDMKETQWQTILKTPAEQLWTDDLDELEAAYERYMQDMEEKYEDARGTLTIVDTNKKGKKGKKTKVKRI